VLIAIGVAISWAAALTNSSSQLDRAVYRFSWRVRFRKSDRRAALRRRRRIRRHRGHRDVYEVRLSVESVYLADRRHRRAAAGVFADARAARARQRLSSSPASPRPRKVLAVLLALGCGAFIALALVGPALLSNNVHPHPVSATFWILASVCMSVGLSIDSMRGCATLRGFSPRVSWRCSRSISSAIPRLTRSRRFSRAALRHRRERRRAMATRPPGDHARAGSCRNGSRKLELSKRAPSPFNKISIPHSRWRRTQRLPPSNSWPGCFCRSSSFPPPPSACADAAARR